MMANRVGVDPNTIPGDPARDPANRLPSGGDVIKFSVILWPTPKAYSGAHDVSPMASEVHHIEATVTRWRAKKQPDGTLNPGNVRRIEIFWAEGRTPASREDARNLRKAIRQACADKFNLELSHVRWIVLD
jgi:hypothetical protein